MNKTPKISHHVASGAARLRHVFVRDLEIKALLGIYDQERIDAAAHHRQYRSLGEGGPGRSATTSQRGVLRDRGEEGRAIVARAMSDLVETLAELIAASCLKDKRVMAAG